MLKKMAIKKKINIKIIAEADTEEFALDVEELPAVLEDIVSDIMHEVSGLKTKDVTIKVVK